MPAVRIQWEGPLSLETARTHTDRVKDRGLYHVYGRHLVFGPGALLYIGRGASDDTRDVRFCALGRTSHRREPPAF